MHALYGSCLATSQAMELSEQPFAVKKIILDNSGSMWLSVVVHEHWPVSQRMIVEMGDYTWSEHIVILFLACQITIKNVQVQLTVKGKRTRGTLHTLSYTHK